MHGMWGMGQRSLAKGGQMKAFMMTAEIAQQFFERCIQRNAQTDEERIKILEELVKELQAIRMNEEACTSDCASTWADLWRV